MPMVVERFVSKFHGRLRQWWITLDGYRQNMVRQCQTIDALIMYVYQEFLGAWDHYTTQSREEYLSMKCCSYKRKDLELHYERMSRHFYAINGIDDVNLKQTFLNSIPEPLGNETTRLHQIKNLPISNAILGELYQHVLLALDKLYNQNKFFKQIEEQGKSLASSCYRKNLQIRCGKEKSCKCSKGSKYPKHSKEDNKGFFPEKKGWKFLKKKNTGNIKSSRCYIYRQKGHFAKDYPDQAKSTKLIEAVS